MNRVKLFSISLNKGQMLQLDPKGSKKLYFECTQGTAWMTFVDDHKDYILSAGEQINIDQTKEKLVLESVSGQLEINVFSVD